MSKILSIAIREFLATACTKAFIFGMLMIPVFGGILVLLAALGLFESPPPKAEGTILVLDRTKSSFVADALDSFYSPDSIKAEREKIREQSLEISEKVPFGTDQQKEASADFTANMLAPTVVVERLPEDADIEAQKARVKSMDNDVMLLFIVDERSIEVPLSSEEIAELPEEERAEATRIGAYEVYQNKDMRATVYEQVRRELRQQIIDERISRAGFDPQQIDRLRTSPRAAAVTLTESGETRTVSDFAQLLPMAFFMLLYMSVMFGGQYLLMSTIEEKSTRVMEVLLSAVSPTQLLLGKIIGQGAVGLMILVLYGGIGVLAADQFDLLALIPGDLLWWVLFYFFVAYAFFASLFAAAGSAVSDIREASSLTSPIMFLMFVPFFLWVPITQNPEGIIAIVTSYIPPLTPYIMVLRMCQPGVSIPMWELIATTIVALGGVAFMVFAAVKIFRVGVLMYGKPPSFFGLLKWIRYA